MKAAGVEDDEAVATSTLRNLERHNVRIEDGKTQDELIDVEEVDEDEVEDNTCCRRATWCNPRLRAVIVTETISTCLGRSLTWADLFWLVTSTGLVSMTWAMMFFLLGPTMLPGGDTFGFFILVVFSYTLGWLLTYIPYLNLPPVFGMLLAGIIVRNTDLYNIHDQLGPGPTSKIRSICLTFIMIRAGLELTTTALREHPFVILFLAFLPSSVEMFVISCTAFYVLGYPMDWAFLTGTIVSCMSPVVTVNCMLSLAEKGYGEDKGVASLLCTASSIESVHLMLVFSICYSVVFTNGDTKKKWWSSIPGGLREFILFLTGIFVGLFLAFFPHRNHKHAEYFRVAGLVAGSLMCTTAASTMAATGGGFLATFILSFIAITGWKILTISYDTIPLRRAASFMWHFMQPILVGVIGADIDFRDWSLGRFGLYVVCILAGLMMRFFCVLLSTYKTDFSLKERIFIALAWIPKGTIQAALAPMAFERARKENDPRILELAVDVLRMSVVAIVFLAPLGAIVIMSSGPLLLNKITDEERQRARRLSYLRIVSLQPLRSLKSRADQYKRRKSSRSNKAVNVSGDVIDATNKNPI